MGTQSRRSPPRELIPTRLPLEATLRARLIRRYKRFLADVETDDGEVLTVHCPNPGAMTGTDRPGSRVRCSTSDDPKRKLRHTLEMIRVGRVYVGLHAARANQLMARALAKQAIPELAGYGGVRPEVAVEGGSRLDFALDDHPKDKRRAYVEVKSVTLADDGHARFPDAVTDRGRRHVETLARLHAAGARAVLVFLVQRADVERVGVAADVDPAYADALAEAMARGVEVLTLGARVDARSLRLERTLPFTL